MVSAISLQKCVSLLTYRRGTTQVSLDPAITRLPISSRPIASVHSSVPTTLSDAETTVSIQTPNRVYRVYLKTRLGKGRSVSATKGLHFVRLVYTVGSVLIPQQRWIPAEAAGAREVSTALLSRVVLWIYLASLAYADPQGVILVTTTSTVPVSFPIRCRLANQHKPTFPRTI